MTSTPIQVTEVSKRFGDVQALGGISLSVGRGEMFGLIGHNGAGKSTLFKLMLGLIKPSGGELRLHGALTSGPDFRQARRRIGYLPENFITYDNLSGLEVLQLFADLKQVPRVECAPLLERVGLGAAAGRRVRGYSKGMRQRLGFAQALLGNPDLIFLDEPTNGLDPEGIHDFYRILREAQGQGVTIVITSHILAEIQERVDRLAILHSGRIAAQGTLPQLRAQMVLPSVVELWLRPGQESQVRAALAQLADIGLDMSEDRAHITCPPGQKLAVLGAVAALAGAVNDIAVHEPSLEDVFLGYGGKHA